MISNPNLWLQGWNYKKEAGQLTFRLKPTKDPCIYEIVGKSSIPSIYEERHKHSNQNCCDHKYSSMKSYNLNPDKTKIDFRKDSESPFFIWISNKHNYSAECLNAATNSSFRKIDYKGNWDLHKNSWPLKNGFVDDIRISRFELIIDEKEIMELKDRCMKAK